MALSINWGAKVITVPQADLTFLSGVIYEHDVDAFQRELSDILDSEEGQPQLPTHIHTTELTLAGVTYARSIEIINGYTVTYENGNYRVNLIGANNNIIDVLNYNSVQVVPNNSAGLITVTSGSGVTAQDKTDIINGVWTKALESGLTAEEITRIMLSALTGKTTGVGTSNEIYKSVDTLTDRIDVTFDGSNNRIAVTLDGT